MNKKLIIFLSCVSVVAALCVALPLSLKQPVDDNEVKLSQVEKVKMDDVESRLSSKAFIDYRIVDNVKYLRYSVAVDASRANSVSISRDTAGGYETSTNDIFILYKGIDFKGVNMYYDLPTNRLTSVKPSDSNYYFACYSVKLENKSQLSREFTFSGSIIGVDNEEYELPVVTASCDDHWDHYSPVASTTVQNGIREFWEDGSGKLAFEKPDSNHITDVGEPERAFIDSLDENDLRLIPQLGGGIDIPTYTNVGWDVKATSPARVDFNVSKDEHQHCADFRNYQYFNWRESDLGITATYTNPNPIGVNKISFVYYFEREIPVSGAKADLTVTISIVDNLGNKVEIDSFVIAKTEPNSSAWIYFTKNFNTINFNQLVIETKNEYVYFTEGQLFNHFYLDNLLISGNAAYTDSISTTNPTNWSSVPRNPNYPQNTIAVGNKSWWGEDSAGGEYLAVRAYQFAEWDPGVAGVTAKYTNDSPKIVNKLDFKYFINSGSFVAPEATIKIYVISGEAKTLVDMIELNKDTATMGVDIDHSITFDNLLLSELHIELFTNAPKGTNGNTVVFFKNMGVNAITGPNVPAGDIDVSTNNASYWSRYSSNNDNLIVAGTGPYYGSGSEIGDYLTIRTYQEENATTNTKKVTAIYENVNEMKRTNNIGYKYYLNPANFVGDSSMNIKITVVGNGKRTLIDTLVIDDSTAKSSVIERSISFEELVFDGLEIEVTSAFADATHGSTCFFVKEIKASFIA